MLKPIVYLSTIYVYHSTIGRRRTQSNRRPPLDIAPASGVQAFMGFSRKLADIGLACPGDVSVTGFNDMPLVDMVAPPLTTLRIPHHAMGARAADILLQQIDGDGLGEPQLVLAPELIVRGSTRAVAEAEQAPAS